LTILSASFAPFSLLLSSNNRPSFSTRRSVFGSPALAP
jgi:hypothetical protein